MTKNTGSGAQNWACTLALSLTACDKGLVAHLGFLFLRSNMGIIIAPASLL